MPLYFVDVEEFESEEEAMEVDDTYIALIPLDVSDPAVGAFVRLFNQADAQAQKAGPGDNTSSLQKMLEQLVLAGYRDTSL